MQTFDEFAELARVWAAQARLTNSPEVAHALWKMAKDYQERRRQEYQRAVPTTRDGKRLDRAGQGPVHRADVTPGLGVSRPRDWE